MSDLNKLRQLFRKRYIKHVLTSVLLGGKYRTIVDHFWEDLRKILIYDCKRQKRKEAYVPLPQIWSNDGKKVLKLFLEAYENERPMTDMQWESILIERGGWRCACGRTNAAYTSTCVWQEQERNSYREATACIAARLLELLLRQNQSFIYLDLCLRNEQTRILVTTKGRTVSAIALTVCLLIVAISKCY